MLEEIILVCAEDIEAVYDIYQRYGLVAFPALHSIGSLYNDNEVVILALVVDLGLLLVGASHFAGV